MEKHLYIARLLTELLDSKFRIGKFSFGLDPFIGFVPVIGDLVTLALSLYLLLIAVKLKMPPEKQYEMITNILADFILGLFPVIGDMTDFVFKANTRNMKILDRYYRNIIDIT